jgi:hypothetical protein
VSSSPFRVVRVRCFGSKNMFPSHSSVRLHRTISAVDNRPRQRSARDAAYVSSKWSLSIRQEMSPKTPKLCFSLRGTPMSDYEDVDEPGSYDYALPDPKTSS